MEQKNRKKWKGDKKFPLTFSTFQLSLYFFLCSSTKYVTASNPATAKIASKPGVGEGEGEGVGVVGATGETGGVGDGEGVGVGVGVGETVGEGDGVGDGTAAKISTVTVSVCPSKSSAFTVYVPGTAFDVSNVALKVPFVSVTV